MTTNEPEPINGPPSWRCQYGAGSLPRSTSPPRMEFFRKGVDVVGVGVSGLSFCLFFIPGFRPTEGPRLGVSPRPGGARPGGVGAMVKNRDPWRVTFKSVEQQ